jgi:hypothetical protein
MMEVQLVSKDEILPTATIAWEMPRTVETSSFDANIGIASGRSVVIGKPTVDICGLVRLANRDRV